MIGIILIIQNSLLLAAAGWWVNDRWKQRWAKNKLKRPFFDLEDFPNDSQFAPCGGNLSIDDLEHLEKQEHALSDIMELDPLALTYDTLLELLDSGTYNGTTQDEMEEGYGEFGWDLTNPIPTVNRRGARQYLSLLRTTEGKPVRHHLQGSFKAENVDYSVDLYILYTEEEVGWIYISSFQETNSHKAPDGFYLDIKS